MYVLATHLLPRRLFLCQGVQSFVERISDDGSHRLVPRPVSIYTRLPQEMHESLLALLHGRKSVMGDDGVVRQVRSCREDARGVEGEAAGVHADSAILPVQMRLRLRTGLE